MQLPVFNIITEAISDTWASRRDLATFAFLPVLMLAIIGTLMAGVIGDPRIIFENPGEVPPSVIARMFFGTIVNWIFGLLFYTLFAVAWYRRNLVGLEATTLGVAMRWSGRQWRFFRRLLVLIVNLFGVLFILSALLANVMPIAPVLSALLIVIGLIYARAALVFPALATDRPMTFFESVKLTNGNSWRMMMAIVVLPFVVMLFGGIAVLIIVAPLANLVGSSVTAQFLVSLIAQSVNYIGFAVGITALSLAYRQLTA
jgi:hypothetical protein